ncbi:MAG: V-type ATP synthase subunit A [Acidobacteriota bacterium]|nr:V-type ATP synthase subunit A [Acidobacteriota bacterium]MDW3229265.1 V-type ATP synthase subunit A [Acidobacteriota bacterium]MDY0231512.1 V-type ATP synthase subunit A [Candidatus Saccharicenans sp.]
MRQGKIIRVAGPLVVASECLGAKMYDMVRVGSLGLIGEIIELNNDQAYIQVYEDTTGVGPGEPVFLTERPLSVELGPGLLGSIYDGIQRPLDVIRAKQGFYISRGIEISALNREKSWQFEPAKKKGDRVLVGDIIGYVQETPLIQHRIMVPENCPGEIIEIKEGEFLVTDSVCKIKTESGEEKELNLFQVWPIRRQRPVKERLMPVEPLITGQRILDMLFPLAKGGTACVPGPFGSGKTVVQHQLAKWSDAQIIVYVACGERGNEVADLLLSFPELKDPTTGRPLLERTIIIANTSNMPVAAREASIYTGMTIAEYFRDMGYSVALMADSSSRWAEALREIGGRMEEMPGDEGYPAYLASRLAEFYERAGKVSCLGSDDRAGALSVIGAVSPPGGDLSDPVVQATLKVVKVFWALDDRLANMRHFPAINWLQSYSLYQESLKKYFSEKIAEDFVELSQEAMRLLELEDELQEIARLIGVESLSFKERLILETARSIREDFLHQNAFHPQDTYTSLKKQYLMLRTILGFHHQANQALDEGIEFNRIVSLEVRESIAKMKYLPEDEEELLKVEKEIKTSFKALQDNRTKGEDHA